MYTTSIFELRIGKDNALIIASSVDTSRFVVNTLPIAHSLSCTPLFVDSLDAFFH